MLRKFILYLHFTKSLKRGNINIIKEVHSNMCMTIHISLKPTQYIIKIFKTRFLMRNCLKYAQQCQNGILRKHVGHKWYPIQWISPQYYVHNGSIGNPLIPDAEKHALRPFYSLNSKIGM